MGELLSIRDVVKEFDKNPLVYSVEGPRKKPPQKVSARAYGKGQKGSGAKATASKRRK